MTCSAAALFATLALRSMPLAAQEAELPFAMPIPEGWRTETILFPLEFAPDLPYSGLEELRFAPGMFDETSDELWTYSFVWWIRDSDPTEPEALATHLETYFRGLAHAVGEARDVAVGEATFGAEIRAGDDGGFSGTAETFDAFVTRGQMRLNLRGEVRDCPAQRRQAVLFALSPQEPGHTVWKPLGSILSGFRCEAPLPDPLP